MKQIHFLLLIIVLASVHAQDDNVNLDPNASFDSATTTPTPNLDAAPTPTNLRAQQQPTPPSQPTPPKTETPQTAPPSQKPQQQPTQKAPASPATPQVNIQQPVPQVSASNTGSLDSPKILMSEVNHPILSKGFKIDQGISYQRIKVGELEKKYLFFNFNLAEKDKWQEVNITVSNEGSSLILNQCQYKGVDNCFIPSSSLKPNTVLFVHIQCQDDCTYNLNAQWSDTEHLLPDQEVIFMFGKDTTQIYHVELEDEDDFEEVRIHLAPRVTRKPFDNIKIYGKFGKEVAPTPQAYDFKSVNLWEDGEGIFLKQSALKQKQFTLLIVGQTETTYRLAMQLVRESTHEISNGEHIYEYLQAKSEKTYHIKSIPAVFDQYSLRFSVLSGGDLDIGYYTDKQLKHKLEYEPFEYMKDSEYIFDTNVLDPNKAGLYVHVQTKERDATYAIKFVGRTKKDSIQLNENVYGFIQVINETKFAHFDFKRWAEETETSNMKFTVYMIEAAGSVKPEFFVCLSVLSVCTNPNLYKNATQPITVKKHDDVSQKQIYELQIQDKLLKKINVAEQQATIIIKLTPNTTGKNAFNLVAVELLNNNKVLYLREGRPLEEKMGQKEMKIYKYINSDPNVEEIRIHINEIAGHVVFSGFIQNEDMAKSIQVLPEGNTLRFTKNLTQPIYTSVNSHTKAIFGISMQIIHKTQAHKNINIATISEDVTYTVKIPPNSFAIYEVVPIFYDFSFSYTASQSIVVCAINPQTNSCIDPNGENILNPNLGVKGELTKAQIVDRKARVKITNPFSDSIAEVTFIFHSRLFDHCDDKKIGLVYQEVVKDNSCISYPIQHDDKTIELYISKRQFASLAYRVLICGNNLSNANTVKTLEITPELIQKLCSSSNENKKLSILWSVTTKNVNRQEKEVRVDLLAQYKDGPIVLAEGVSYNKIATVASQPFIGRFAYNLINKKDTKVILSQIRGRFKIYAKIVRQEFRDSDPISNINYHFASSQTIDYSQEPTILISEADIKKDYCIDCAIIIAVYTENEEGAQVEFDIQIVQRYSVLNEDTSVDGYLDAGSFAYYSYTARSEENSTILFLISDHNQQCANMYVSYFENPGINSHIAKVIQGNELIVRHSAGERKYYLSVEAVKTCDFSLSVLTIDSSIHNLKRGKQSLIKFPQGVVKYFSLDHYTNEPFKIISLTKYGEINMYLNKSRLTVNRKSFTTSELALDKFEYKSEHPNTLSIDTAHPIYCQKCNYFLAIEALKNTEATLYLVYPQTTITLTEGHFLSDFLAKKNDYTLATYNRVEKTQVYIKVYTGSINVTAVFKQKTISGSFTPSNSIQSLDIDFEAAFAQSAAAQPIPEADPNLGKAPATPSPPTIERIPINLLISANSDNTTYTLEMKSMASSKDINQLATYQSVIPGEPNAIEISNIKPLCLTGYLREPNEALILSTNNDNSGYLNKLIMQATVKNLNIDVEKSISRNIMVISFVKSKTTLVSPGSRFEVCLKIAQTADRKNGQNDNSVTEMEEAEASDEFTFTASITQSNTVNILPIDTEAVVKDKSIFVVHSQGEFLLDVFECKDKVKINIGHSLENIEKTKLKMLDMVSMPDQTHAIKVSQKETTFVKIESVHSIVKWMPIDYETERGLGYIKYAAGDITYYSNFKEIGILFQPLQHIKPTNIKVKEVKYTLYIADNLEDIQWASQCSVLKNYALAIPLDSPPILQSTQSQKLWKPFDKTELDKLFPISASIYFTVVCELSLEVAKKDASGKLQGTDEHEHYRFIYSRQQIPGEAYKPTPLENIPYHYLILLFVAIAAILVLFTYLFTRKIVPLIARLRNSSLVEEEPAPEHKDDLEVPASSDRNQRAPDIAVETEDKFGK